MRPNEPLPDFPPFSPVNLTHCYSRMNPDFCLPFVCWQAICSYTVIILVIIRMKALSGKRMELLKNGCFSLRVHQDGKGDLIEDRLTIVAHELGKSRLIQSLERRADDMQIVFSPQPVIAIIAGILILFVPRLLSYIVAAYLIIFGILGLVR